MTLYKANTNFLPVLQLAVGIVLLHSATEERMPDSSVRGYKIKNI